MVIAHDPRVSGPILESALCAGLAAEGVDVELLGMLPTPAIAAVSARESVPGIVVTASHNPYTDNGVKVFAAGGRKLSDDVQFAIEIELEDLRTESGRGTEGAGGAITRRLDADEDYIDHLVEIFGGGTLAGMRIAIDTANGAMSVVAPALLGRLGADVVVLNDAPTGLNINDGCGATAPQSLCEFVAEAHDGLDVDIAFAFDGDGDRVIAVDENGKVVDGDRLIALSALERLGSGTLVGGTVVVTVMTNLGFHRAMHAAGIDVVTTSVGDRSVLQEMESNGYVIGGEQSGHIIHRDLATTGDGLLAAIVLARMVRRERAATGRPFSDIAAAVMTNVPQVLRAVPVTTKPVDVEADLADSLATARERLGERGRILVRMSGTEPVVRVMVEADDADMAEETASELVSAVVSRWGGREPAP
jgi:phosphoglucosamine mutase